VRKNVGRFSISNESKESDGSNEPSKPLRITVTSTPAKYLVSLDKPTKGRIEAKLSAIAQSPFDTRLSKPLVGQTKRSSRVGGYRILFEIIGEDLMVSDIGPRGQIYRNLKK
jgi:mRNA-degrading endonuclease RelE of RelBE toxin-antitoxin system